MSDILARLHELARTLPEPPPVVRIEVGRAMHDWLAATARPEGAPPENPWRPEGWTPPPLIAALFGVPVVLNEDLEPGAWRAIGRDGEVMKEGALGDGPKVQVTFVQHIANPAAPRAEEIAGGTDLTFTRREGPPLELPPRRFEVAHWPDGMVKVREVPFGHEPVSTPFGPFHRDPDEAITRELREAIESGTWCEVHGRIEPGPHYRVCGECGHGWTTAEALVADHAAMVERLNASLPPPPWDPAWYGPIVAATDTEEITCCPHCSHDL